MNVSKFTITASQKATVEELRNSLPHKNYKLFGFVSEPIAHSRNLLALREYGDNSGKVKIYESYVIGPRGKVNAKTVLPHVEQ